MHHRNTRQVTAHAQKRRMPEGQHAGVAKDQIEAHRKQAENQDVHGQRFVGHQPRKHQ